MYYIKSLYKELLRSGAWSQWRLPLGSQACRLLRSLAAQKVLLPPLLWHFERFQCPHSRSSSIGQVLTVLTSVGHCAPRDSTGCLCRLPLSAASLSPATPCLQSLCLLLLCRPRPSGREVPDTALSLVLSVSLSVCSLSVTVPGFIIVEYT